MEKEDSHAENYIVNTLNPERKIFAVCIEIDEFAITNEEETMIEMKTHRKAGVTAKTLKSVKFQDLEPPKASTEVIISKRTYCIFSYYPFFAFFEELLKSLIYAVKVERYIRYKEGG